LHQLSFARFRTCAAALALIALCAQAPAQTVDVLYAGSLVTPMEGPVKTALAARGIAFAGEPGGSKQLANLILAGAANPDVFICVDPRLIARLATRVAWSEVFAGTSLGIAWSPQSRYAALFDRVAAGTMPLARALQTPGVRIGRTDPRLDPKGAYTIEGVRLWLGSDEERKLLGADENPAQIFPEEVLLARIETGEIDAGFFYRTEAVARGYRFVPLPGRAALTERIAFALAVMKDAPHPRAAKAFADFVLTGPGRAILERAGLTYITPAGSR
jgi:molybdate/tungstate transport system substrate-binding protein